MITNREFKGESLLDLVDNYVLVDIETTGLSPTYNDIIEIGAIKVENNKIVDTFESLITISTELDPFITNLTGITNEMLQKYGKNINIVLSSFIDFIGNNVLVAHNANFDINFLYDKCLLYSNLYLKNDFIDTMKVSKKLYPNLPNYKLSTLADHFNIDYSNAHRSIEDVKITFEVYNNLKHLSEHYYEIKLEEIKKTFTPYKDFYNKKVVVKTMLKTLDYQLIKKLLEEQQSKTYDIFYSFCDYLIINDSTYEKYISTDKSTLYVGSWMYKAKELEITSNLRVLSESKFCNFLNIPYYRNINTKKERFSAKDIFPQTDSFDETHPLYNKNCVFTGILEKMDRKHAMQLVVNVGGKCQDSVTSATNYLILGNNDYCHSIKDGKSTKQKKAEALKLKGNDIEIIPEDVFYEMILEN